ncbi:hypothetical protein [Halarcobacter ebronensis]|uniref:VCBS repeat-containing protein n=1 Tax=Halarcobacter ebronensis TaxID=1462615 RepID=A0A4Q1ARS5_9BACT|nr:hypothetical protein [Halarcobacter ebronensis]QKF82749.1 hypothetical protein AEBR_2281 [Halarcobacter ebronensis]RXK06774.1 hypothetical protein CRV07_04915 [Halarcobacter ebronensis]
MLIESYNLKMQSASSFVQKHESSINSTSITQKINDRQSGDDISSSNIQQVDHSKSLVFNSEENLSIKDRMIKTLIEMLLGKFKGKKTKESIYPFSNELKNKNYIFNPSFSNGTNINSYGASFETTETYYQKSSVYFETKATINTNNGSFNINLNLSYTQEFYEQHKTKIELYEVNLQDPLIINFSDDASGFDNIDNEMTFKFDINSNKEKEDLPLLKKGSGFLALDKNNNNEIDDGSELFGAKTGDGFEELAKYDEDGNNWIDEADSIFKDLRIWQINENGENNLITLGQAGVGAIFLSSIASGFSYSQSYGNQTASLKESSIFLKENGEAGLITSVDLVV